MRRFIALALAACLLTTLAARPASPEPLQVAPQPMTFPRPPRPSECVLPFAGLPTPAERDAFCSAQKREADTCTANDGAWGVPGLSYPGTPPHCTLPTPDAGRVCTANSDCRRSACKPEDGAGGRPGQATGRCDKYGEWIAHCYPTIDNGTLVVPTPCPLY